MNDPLNVQRRVREEQVITNRLIDIKEAGHAMRACEWENSRERTDVVTMQLSETKKIAAELEQENKMLLLQRKARLREFLTAEAEVFEQQLNAMGKAFCKPR
uniref:Uncharacterized protein n=1 Tax=Haptolina brevifila TaxID=156173 RepID=A0A7S2FV38_9EUKA|mmetsp:Transcript_20725/g.42127  ORF Transcript_20725/g.42127 Transcript_20725/m.42127 type:complete len:102 (+) Transcript_20725:85-390(+)